MFLNYNTGFTNISEITILPSFSAFSVSWGDGTYSNKYPHNHVYSSDGEYIISIEGCSANSAISLQETVCIEDLIKPSIEFETYSLSSYAGDGAEFKIQIQSPYPETTIYFYASGSNSVPHKGEDGFWDHLNPRWGFFKNADRQPFDFLKTQGTPILTGGVDNPISYYSEIEFKYIDDMPGNVILFATMGVPFGENSRIYAATDHEIVGLPPTKLKISEDGIQNINKTQWAGVPIPFVISFSNDVSNILHYVSGGIVTSQIISDCHPVTSSIISQTINLYDENCFNSGGYLLSSITIDPELIDPIKETTISIPCSNEIETIQTRIPAFNCKLTVSAIGVFDGQEYTLTGESTPFLIYPFDEFYKFRRIGESENLSEQLNYYAFTDRMRGHSLLWDYINGIMGDGLESLGTKSYFGIERFVDQISDIDRCNLKSIIDKAEMMDVSIDDYGINSFPTGIRRILDVASIPIEKIVGTKCKCIMNFFTPIDGSTKKCKICGIVHDSNLGSVISLNDYVLNGEELIYLDKNGGDTYGIFNVVIEEDSTVLSALNLEFDRYCYYRWNKSGTFPQIECEIDYDSPHTSLSPEISSVEDWYGDGGIIEELLMFEFIKNLELK